MAKGPNEIGTSEFDAQSPGFEYDTYLVTELIVTTGEFVVRNPNGKTFVLFLHLPLHTSFQTFLKRISIVAKSSDP